MGPQELAYHRTDGFAADDDTHLLSYGYRLVDDEQLRTAMGASSFHARQHAQSNSLPDESNRLLTRLA